MWSRSHEAMDSSCHIGAFQARAGGVAVWGVFTWDSLESLVPKETSVIGSSYVNIRSDYLHPFT